MFKLSIPEAKDMIRHVAVDMREPIMFWGEPGVGKSQMVAQLAREYNAPLVDIRLSQYDSVDLRGIPNVQHGMTVWNVPSTLPFKGNPRFDASLPVIFLFLDEINSAAPATSAVGYQLVNDRAVGEHELMDNVVIIAAGNRDTDKGVTNKQPTPLSNRFTHAEIGINAEAVRDHFVDIGMPEIGVAFLMFRKPLISTFIIEKDGKPVVTDQKSFATPRTWEKALRYYASTTMPLATKQAAMAGAVGDGPAGEFWGFVEVYDKIKTLLPAIKKNPESAEIPQDRSFVYAITVALSGDMNVKTAPSISKYLMRLESEFVILAWMLALKRDEELYTTDEYMAYASKYKSIFQK